VYEFIHVSVMNSKIHNWSAIFISQKILRIIIIEKVYCLYECTFIWRYLYTDIIYAAGLFVDGQHINLYRTMQAHSV